MELKPEAGTSRLCLILYKHVYCERAVLTYVVDAVAVATVALFRVEAGAFRTMAMDAHDVDVEKECDEGFDCRRVRRAPRVVCDRSMV